MAIGRSIRRWMSATSQDFRFGIRILGRTPFATSVMVVSVALSIGVHGSLHACRRDAAAFCTVPTAERLVVPYQT
jgi:hypothetical protein